MLEIRLLGAALILPLVSGCAGPISYLDWSAKNTQAFTVDQIKADPDKFLSDHLNRRVLVQGYLGADHMMEAVPIPDSAKDNCFGNRDIHPKTVQLDLQLPRKQFDRSISHWVVIEAIVRQPRNLMLGGGDLVVPVTADEQYVYLEDGKLLAVDDARACVHQR